MFCRRSFSLVAALGLLAALSGVGCSADIENNGQLAGQTCYTDGDCAGTMVCQERVCVPTTIRHADGAGLADAGAETGPPDNDTGPQADSGPPQPDVIVVPDTGPPGCGEAEARECLGPQKFRVCREDGEWSQGECTDRSVCINGVCQQKRIVCNDEDGDGYHVGCPVANPDCDDTDPNTNPGVKEKCNNDFDDNCNDEVDEGCLACCEGGCGMGEFCDDCTCTPYRSMSCQAQNQPCSREGRSNGYFCSEEITPNKRCFGLCNTDAQNPDATCPDANSTCLYELDRGSQQGVCFSNCKLNQGCGIRGMGCLPYDGGGGTEGVCVQTNQRNQVGDECAAGSTFDCEAGALCVGGDRGQPGQCRQACRPFADPNSTDCDGGTKCLPISSELGICVPDNGRQQGDRCMQQSTTCGSDAVGCFGGQRGDARCYRLCRVNEGSADCQSSDARCRRIGRDGDLGVCTN